MKPIAYSALLLWCSSIVAMTYGAAEEKPLNVIFIVIDDLRPEVGSYGTPDMITPNMDRLAARGVQFKRAYSQYPVCNPSRASFLTGKRPDELGILSNSIALRKEWPDVTTLPQLFRNNGYFTAGLGKILHTGLDENGEQTLFRDDASYDHQFRALGNSPAIGRTGEGRMLGDGSIVWAEWLAAEGGDEAQPDGMLAAEAVSVLEERHDKPFFLGVGFHKPHDPFFAPKEYFDLYPLDEVKLPQAPADGTPLLNPSIPNGYDGFSSFTDRDRREFKRAYRACTTFVDAQVGKVFAVMDRLKLWESTIVVVMGDHGYHLGEQDWWNKDTIFDVGGRTPLMMWVPGIQSMGQAPDSIVELLDLYPTLTDLCGLEPPHKLSGKSLRPVLENPSEDWGKPAFAQVTRGGALMGYSVQRNNWHYIRWGLNDEVGTELYDHRSDPGEYYNLTDNPEYRKLREAMGGLLKEGFPLEASSDP